MYFKGKATSKQLDRIVELRNVKDISGSQINVNELYSDYVSEFTADCLIRDLERCDNEVKPIKTVKNLSLKIGIVVENKIYGEGTILKVNKDKITVDFNGNVKIMFSGGLKIKEAE